MSVSDKVREAMQNASWIRRMFEQGDALKAQHGADKVFDLSLGNPNLDPPPEFYEELRRLVENPRPGMHRYMPNAGYPEARATVAEALSQETGLPFTAGEVVMTVGAAGAINVVLHTILNPGDEVIILAPYFVEYLFYTENHGGVPRIVPTTADFQLDLEAIAEALGLRTRAVLINSPNNPTGVVYPADALGLLGRLLEEHSRRTGREVFLLSDEPYRKLIYDGLAYPHVFPHYTRTIVATSHSKDLGLAGERIGYIAVHPSYEGREELLGGLTFSNRVLGFVNAPALMQRVIARLQGVTVDVPAYQRKRDLLYQGLTSLGYDVVRPQGAFYMFPRSPIDDDVAFVAELQRHLVLAVPGRGFGTPGYFRLSYCVEDRVLEGAMEGLRKAMGAAGGTGWR